MAFPVRKSEPDAVQWDPLADLDRLNQHLAGYLDRWGELPAMAGGFTPLADVEETDDAYVIEIELPGVKRDDVAVEVAGRQLSVSGERKERERVGILRRRTRTVGRFHYEVVLPGDVEEEACPPRWMKACSQSGCPSPPRPGRGASPSAEEVSDHAHRCHL